MDDPSLQPNQETEARPEITLRPFILSDVDDFMAWASDDRVSRWCSWDTYTNKEDLLSYLKDKVLPHPWFRAICLPDNRPIGAISVMTYSGVDRCRGELGYVLAHQYWGQGIVSQAVNMVISSIFTDFPHLERLEALVDVENIGSQKVLEKIGFTKEGVLRRYWTVKGKTKDMVMYSFLSSGNSICS